MQQLKERFLKIHVGLRIALLVILINAVILVVSPEARSGLFGLE